jgi:hypothetical protein
MKNGPSGPLIRAHLTQLRSARGSSVSLLGAMPELGVELVDMSLVVEGEAELVTGAADVSAAAGVALVSLWGLVDAPAGNAAFCGLLGVLGTA